MSNLDKDIEQTIGNINHTLVQKIDNVFTTLLENRNIFPKEFIDSLMYVLDMLVNKQLNTDNLRVCDFLQEIYKNEREKIYYEEYSKKLEKKDKELETKDKIIDLMAEILSEFDFDKMCGDCPCDYCTAREDTDEYMDCIKEYFRNKVLNNE